jgi:hypothetical protein
MKRLILLSLFLLLIFPFLSFNVSGQVCNGNGPDDIIMRISGTSGTNGVGQLWDSTPAYLTEICFSDVFTGQNIPSNPHSCIGPTNNPDNLILRLNDITNAHAETPDNPSPNPVYDEDVCYGNLACYSTTGSCNTGAGEYEVVSLSGPTNAHIELSPLNNPGYDTKICCSLVGGFIDAYWTDFANVRLSPPLPPSSPEIYICGDTSVKAKATTAALSVQVDVEIWDYDFIVHDYITTLTGNIVNDEIIVDWDIDMQEIIDAQSPFGAENDDIYEIYFIAKEPGGEEIESDYQIHVVDPDGSRSEKCPLNPGPTGGMTELEHLGLYFTNDPVEFDNDCASSIGELTYSWTIEQGGSVIHTETESTFSYTFASPGQADVTLECTDEQALRVIDNIVIAVSGSPALATWINPKDWEVVNNAPPSCTPGPACPYFPNEVHFKGSDTFVVFTFPKLNAHPTPAIANAFVPGFNSCVSYCLAGTNGKCPHSMSKGIPGIGTPYPCDVPVSILDTADFNTNIAQHIAGQPPIDVGHDGLNFDWTFSDSSGYNENQVGSGLVDGFKYYPETSDAINDKKITLTTEVKSLGPIDSFNAWYYTTLPGLGFTLTPAPRPVETLEVDFTLGYCLNGGNEFLTDAQNGITDDTLTVKDACKGYNDIGGDADDCCPDFHVCEDDGLGDYYCVIPANPVFYCEDFDNENDCNENTDPRIPERSYRLPLDPCEQVFCTWNSNANPEACEVEIVSHPQSNGQCPQGPIGPTGCVNNRCLWNVEISPCEGGQQTISYTSSAPTGSPSICGGSSSSCSKPPQVVACGNLGFELPYFGPIQFIATLLIILVIYLAINSKKKNE